LKRDAGVPVAVGIGLDTAEREEFKQLRKLASDQAKTIEILKKRRPLREGERVHRFIRTEKAHFTVSCCVSPRAWLAPRTMWFA
jgi:hypothetical protein